MLDWLFNKKKKDLDLSRLGIDIHSHLIPGIDDGVQTVEEAIEMLQRLEQLGYKRVVTTPHVMWDCYKNTPEIIRSGLDSIRTAAQQAGLSLRIDAAAEYFIDEHFVEMLTTGQPLLTLPGKRLLVELPYTTPLMNTTQTLFTIIEKGYKPVLAHPERYTYYYQNPAIYKQFCAQGCELQVNALSLTTNYGEGVQKMAQWLLKNELITFIGTDAHRIQHLDGLNKAAKSHWLSDYPFQNDLLLDVE